MVEHPKSSCGFCVARLHSGLCKFQETGCVLAFVRRYFVRPWTTSHTVPPRCAAARAAASGGAGLPIRSALSQRAAVNETHSHTHSHTHGRLSSLFPYSAGSVASLGPACGALPPSRASGGVTSVLNMRQMLSAPQTATKQRINASAQAQHNTLAKHGVPRTAGCTCTGHNSR